VFADVCHRFFCLKVTTGDGFLLNRHQFHPLLFYSLTWHSSRFEESTKMPGARPHIGQVPVWSSEDPPTQVTGHRSSTVGTRHAFQWGSYESTRFSGGHTRAWSACVTASPSTFRNGLGSAHRRLPPFQVHRESRLLLPPFTHRVTPPRRTRIFAMLLSRSLVRLDRPPVHTVSLPPRPNPFARSTMHAPSSPLVAPLRLPRGAATCPASTRQR
jgi:hypothetical protein